MPHANDVIVAAMTDTFRINSLDLGAIVWRIARHRAYLEPIRDLILRKVNSSRRFVAKP